MTSLFTGSVVFQQFYLITQLRKGFCDNMFTMTNIVGPLKIIIITKTQFERPVFNSNVSFALKNCIYTFTHIHTRVEAPT